MGAGKQQHATSKPAHRTVAVGTGGAAGPSAVPSSSSAKAISFSEHVKELRNSKMDGENELHMAEGMVVAEQHYVRVGCASQAAGKGRLSPDKMHVTVTSGCAEEDYTSVCDRYKTASFDPLNIQRPKSADCSTRMRTPAPRMMGPNSHESDAHSKPSNVMHGMPFMRWQQLQTAKRNQHQPSPGFEHRKLQIRATSALRPPYQTESSHIQANLGQNAKHPRSNLRSWHKPK